jgi:hypothetical protein
MGLVLERVKLLYVPSSVVFVNMKLFGLSVSFVWLSVLEIEQIAGIRYQSL